MRPQIVLEHYRVGTPDEPPVEIARNGPAITYKGSDLKSGAPVAVTLIPIDSVDPAERENFEEKARTAMSLDHASIAKTVAFGTAEDFFVFISEYPLGETVDAWVKSNGPMPADAVLRVALQVVSALGAASFQGLTHPAIQPANLVIVRGKTAEGGWPYIKLTHFALAGLKSPSGHPEPDLSASDYASPEQLLQGKVDFRSEIYSLGATLCFLLTGVFYSAYPRSPQTKRFARPLRALVARTLEDDPAERPQDPVLFTEELRTCLAAIERRQELKRKFGIPFSPVVARPPRMPRFRRRRRPTSLLAPIGPTPALEPAVPAARRNRMRYVWAAVALLLMTGVVAALLLPEDVVTAMFRRKKPVESIGVPVGVPESTPAFAQTNRSGPSPVQQTAAPFAGAATAGGLAKTTSERRPEAGTAPAPASVVTTQNSTPMPEPGSVVAGQNSSPAPIVVSQQPVSAPVQQSTAVTNPPPTVDRKAPNETQSTPAMASNSPVTAGTAASTPPDTAAPSPGATPVTVAENNRVTDAAPPAEAPAEGATNENADRPTGRSEENTEDQHPAAHANAGAQDEPTKPRVSPGSSISKPQNRKSTVPNGSRVNNKPRVPRALPVGPEDDSTQPGEMRARVVGITPAGNVILRLPNGERAIVSPQDADQYSEPRRVHRRPHRVIIERRTVYPPPYAAPYQPFIPPDA